VACAAQAAAVDGVRAGQAQKSPGAHSCQ